MVLLVLIVLWGIVLIPPAWQSHAEARRARQVDAFRRKLSVLAPAPDTPLARRPIDAARPFEAARAHVAVIAPRNVVSLRPDEAEGEEYASISGDTSGAPGDELVVAAAAEAAARRAERARARVDVLRRRQRVLMGLMAATLVSLIAAFVLGDVRIWAAHGVVVLAFAAYLVGLRRLRNLAVERRAKVRYLPAPVAVPAAAAGPASAEARRAGAGAR